MKVLSIFLFSFFFSLTVFSGNQDEKPELKQKETAFIAGELAKITDNVTGEQVAWHLNYYLGPILRNCEKDPDNWIAPTERVLNLLADKMATGPDGYKGFIGPYIYNETQHWCDVHVGDAILVTHMLRFSLIVYGNHDMKEKYGKSALRFINIGKKDLIEKWEKRGTYIVDGPFAGYDEWNQFCKPGNMNEWYIDDHPRGQNSSSPALPFNKAMDMGHCMLQIYALTGEADYKKKSGKDF
ncbi:MAG: hypothetical protein LBQ60_08565 [Bacteroidales bacterium]|jgi:hypothetical protein|nr:hypothetical protein [Bacteroidales bacterium]